MGGGELRLGLCTWMKRGGGGSGEEDAEGERGLQRLMTSSSYAECQMTEPRLRFLFNDIALRVLCVNLARRHTGKGRWGLIRSGKFQNVCQLKTRLCKMRCVAGIYTVSFGSVFTS